MLKYLIIVMVHKLAMRKCFIPNYMIYLISYVFGFITESTIPLVSLEF